MKKLFLTLLLSLVLIFSSFTLGNSLQTLDGENWGIMDSNQKGFYVAGFLSCFYFLHGFSDYLISTGQMENATNLFSNGNLSELKYGVEDTMNKVDSFYSIEDNLKWPIWYAIIDAQIDKDKNDITNKE